MSSLPSTSPAKKQNASIKDSLAALRSILMIDTPTKALLDGPHPSVTTQHSRHEANRRQQMEIDNLQNTTQDLKSKVKQANEAATKETRVRKSLESSYDALTKHRQELSVQLEIVTRSRESAEKKLEEVSKTLRAERMQVARERVQWKPELDKLQREKQRLQIQYKSLESRCRVAERKAKDLERQLQRGSSTPRSTNTTQGEASESGTFSDSAIKARLEKAEAARIRAEEIAAKSVAELATIKRRHQKSLSSLLEKQQKLKKDLEQANHEKNEISSRLGGLQDSTVATSTSGVSQEISKLNEEIQKLKKSLNGSEQEKRDLESELRSAREQLQEVSARKVDLESKLESANVGTTASGQTSTTKPTIGLSNSLLGLDNLIAKAANSDANGGNLEVVEELALIAKKIKEEMVELQEAKAEADSALQVNKAADVDLALASSREKLRETADELEDMKEEIEELRLAKIALENQLQYGKEDKRDLEEAEGEDENLIQAKRQKMDEDCDVSI